VTKPRYGSTYPWPLCQIIPYFKQKEMMKILSAQGWCDISQSEVSCFWSCLLLTELFLKT